MEKFRIHTNIYINMFVDYFCLKNHIKFVHSHSPIGITIIAFIHIFKGAPILQFTCTCYIFWGDEDFGKREL